MAVINGTVPVNEYTQFLESFRNEVDDEDGWRDETVHGYEGAIVDYIKETKKYGEENFEKYLEKIIIGEGLDCNDNEDDEKLSYAAYCTLHTYYRRMKEHQKLIELDQNYSSLFENGKHKSTEHFKLLLHVDSGEKVDSVDILKRAKQSAETMPNHTGSWNLLADLVANYYEQREDIDKESISKENWFQEGMDAVNRAIRSEETYGKFYAIRGRLYCLCNQYDKALEDIKKAMDKENISNADYSMRISGYLVLQLKFEAEKEMYLMKKEYHSQMKKLKDMKDDYNSTMKFLEQLSYKNVEILALFAGIVSFIITGINLAGGIAEGTFYYVAGLIIVMLGGLLGIFYGLGIYLNPKKEEKINKRIIGIIIILIMSGLMIGG